MVVGILGAGRAIRRHSHPAETAKRMSRASSDGKVRSGTSTGRCKSPALLVLTLRGRLLRVAFGLMSDTRSQTLVTLLYMTTRR